MNILTKLKDMSAPTKASLFFVLCNIFQKGISLISAPIFTRLLSTEQYGLFTVYNSWYGIISIFATFNLSYGVFIRGLTQYEEDRDTFSSSLLGLSTVITGMCFIVYILRIDFWNNLFGLSTILVLSMFIELLFVPAFAFWSNLQRNEYKYKALVVVTMVMSVLNPLMGVAAVLSSTYKAEARILSMIFVQAIFGLFFYILLFVKGKTFYNKEYWKYALLFNMPLIPHYLSLTVLQQADRIMINNLVDGSKAAIYGVAYTVSTLMLLITSAINNSFTPFTYQSLKKKDYHKIISTSKFVLSIVSIGCVVIMLMGPEVISILAPAEYTEAKWIIPPVSASVFFMFLYPLFGNIEFYFSKTKFTMIASCVGAVLNIALNYVGIKVFGYIAAGYTTLICYIIFAVAHYSVYKKLERENLRNERCYDSNFIFFLSVAMIVMMIFVLVIYNNLIIRYTFIILILLYVIICRKRIICRFKDMRNN